MQFYLYLEQVLWDIDLMRLCYTITSWKKFKKIKKSGNEWFYPWRNTGTSFQDQSYISICGQNVLILDHKSPTVTQFDLKLYGEYPVISHPFPILAAEKTLLALSKAMVLTVLQIHFVSWVARYNKKIGGKFMTKKECI